MIPVSDTDEEDVPVINSLDIKLLLQEQSSIPITMGTDEPTPPSDKDKEDSLIVFLDRDQEPSFKKQEMEDVEMLEELDSSWEDRQRLTDSWYGIKKELEECVPDDDNGDICVQGLLNV